jgi:hypothetical protein
MANFDILKIEKVKSKDLDTAIKSDSANGLVKTRLPYTKIRKQFTLTIPISSEEEQQELQDLYDVVRTVTPFVWNHPTKKDINGNPMQYTVRFNGPVEIEQDGTRKGHYNIAPLVLVEV